MACRGYGDEILLISKHESYQRNADVAGLTHLTLKGFLTRHEVAGLLSDANLLRDAAVDAGRPAQTRHPHQHPHQQHQAPARGLRGQLMPVDDGQRWQAMCTSSALRPSIVGRDMI